MRREQHLYKKRAPAAAPLLMLCVLVVMVVQGAEMLANWSAEHIPRAHAMLRALNVGDVEAPWVGPSAVAFLRISPVVVCQLLWLAPLPTARAVIRRRSTRGLPPLGWFSMLANGYLWSAYGVVAGMDLTIVLPNVTGLLAGAWYSAVFLRHDSGSFDTRPYTGAVAATVTGVTVVVELLPAARAQRVLGWLGVAVCVAMFSGPLQVIRSVIAAQSTRDLPFPMAVATVANCTSVSAAAAANAANDVRRLRCSPSLGRSCCAHSPCAITCADFASLPRLWALFGALVRHDPFVWVPNALGLTSGLVQLCLFARYGIHKENFKKSCSKATAGAVLRQEVDFAEVAATGEDELAEESGLLHHRSTSEEAVADAV